MSANLYFVNRENENPIWLDTPDFNVSTSNVRDILASIGLNPHFEEDPEFPIGIFEEKLKQFIANHGPNSPVHKEIESVADGNWIEWGRRENYLIEKVWRMLGLVNTAKQLGATNGYFS